MYLSRLSATPGWGAAARESSGDLPPPYTLPYLDSPITYVGRPLLGGVLLEPPGEASMWRLTAITSTVAQGWVRHDVRSIKPLLLDTCTGWFGESIVPTFTWPGSEAEAAMLVSQLTGPSK